MPQTGSKLRILVLSACIITMSPTAAIYGQGRGASSIGLRTVGDRSNFGVTRFQHYSYGLGATSRGGSAGVLSNSLANPSSFNISRSGAGATIGGAGESAANPLSSRVLYKPHTMDFSAADDTSRLRAAVQGGSAGYSGQTLIHGFGLEDVGVLESERSIHSFVPDEKGQYTKYIQAGEQAMKERQYDTAHLQFELANHIARKSPESLLSLAHANLAQQQYIIASYYLGQALRYFPELPTAPLVLSSFFADEQEFEQIMADLRTWIEEREHDHAARLVLAYVEWFSGSPQQAAETLRQAGETTDEQLLEALHIFWDGCIATGQIQGQFLPIVR